MMNWLINLLFPKKTPVKPQQRPVRDSLEFVKQHKPTAAPPIKKDPQTHYLRNTLHFAKQQQKHLQDQRDALERWQQHYGAVYVDDLTKLSGVEFENYLVGLFKYHGYGVETTAVTGDYGADLILSKDQQRIALQAKCYQGSVGVSAVQQALSGMAYYRCHSAWVVTTGKYTSNAVELAKQSNVRLIGRNELAELIVQMHNTAK